MNGSISFLSRFLILFISLFFFHSVFAKTYNNHKDFKYAKEDFSPISRVWAGLEFMSMWEKYGPISTALVSQNFDYNSKAILGEPGTSIIYGDGAGTNFDYGNISGGKLILGVWLDDYCDYGLEFNGFWLEKEFTNYDTFGPGGQFPVVAIPFFDTISAAESSSSILVDSGSSNYIDVNTSSQLWGADLNLIYNLSNAISYPVKTFIGFRFISLNETLAIKNNYFDTTSIAPALSTLFYRDDLQTQNNFYGLQFGLSSKILMNQGLTLEIIGKLAIGENAEKIDVSGLTQSTNDAFGVTSQTINSGIFSQQCNSGSYTKNIFTVLPELQIKLGYLATNNVRPYISYDIIYMNNVVRPGDQLDRNINTTENPGLSGSTTITGQLSPGKPKFNNSSFWIQGATIGFEILL
ncbi:BBP7 family outer membrane beta-barrel protein [Gammaproteobacteria bacterium]|nr:BBP7 family outer membrane beta-barrel protein [Gammaproteobacteria bacterium]